MYCLLYGICLYKKRIRIRPLWKQLVQTRIRKCSRGSRSAPTSWFPDQDCSVVSVLGCQCQRTLGDGSDEWMTDGMSLRLGVQRRELQTLIPLSQHTTSLVIITIHHAPK